MFQAAIACYRDWSTVYELAVRSSTLDPSRPRLRKSGCLVREHNDGKTWQDSTKHWKNRELDIHIRQAPIVLL